jgi:hypothetical protein
VDEELRSEEMRRQIDIKNQRAREELEKHLARIQAESNIARESNMARIEAEREAIEEKRKESIQTFCREREIESLIHFTRTDNLARHRSK